MGSHTTAQPLQPEQTHKEATLLSRQNKDRAYLQVYRTNSVLVQPAEPPRGEKTLLTQGIRRKSMLEAI